MAYQQSSTLHHYDCAGCIGSQVTKASTAMSVLTLSQKKLLIPRRPMVQKSSLSWLAFEEPPHRSSKCMEY